MSLDLQDYYQKNIDFWETAWSRVSKPSTRIPETMNYLLRIPEVFKNYEVKHILDLACGSGWLSFMLVEHGFRVTGVDISSSAIALAQSLQNERTISEELLSFKVSDILEMDFPENFFDGVLISACFEHLDYKRGDEFLSKLKKIVKADGILYGIFDKVASGERGTFTLLEDGSHSYTDEFRNGMLLRYYNDDELNSLLLKHNWEVLSIEKNNFDSRIVTAMNKK